MLEWRGINEAAVHFLRLIRKKRAKIVADQEEKAKKAKKVLISCPKG